jgi:molybdopterin-guanine dinucleotide biosynthesis protein A
MQHTKEPSEAEQMKHIIMAGGTYAKWDRPKPLTELKGEPLVARTIRLLRENGITDIAISSNNELFEQFGVPVLKHENKYSLPLEGCATSPWLDAFYPMAEPVCYIFGDVVFSPEAIKTIVKTDTNDIQFFASAKPLPKIYPKQWAEPFAFKVKDTNRFFEAIEATKQYDEQGLFKRQPVAWELWQVIKGTPLNKVDYTNYVRINDYTCDIDAPEDVSKFEAIL